MSQSEKDKINFENNNKKLKEAGLILLGKKARGKQRYLCSKCNTTFYSKRNRIIKNPICRNCMQGKSYGEQVAINILKENNILFEKEKTFKNLKGIGGGKLRFDFYIKKNNGEKFIIEIDGQQHYKECAITQNTPNHDILKNQFALKNNINLYRVNYIYGKLSKVSKDILMILKKEGYNISYEYKPNYLKIEKQEQHLKPKHKKSHIKNECYAIKNGRKNNVIVFSWKECKKLVHKYPNAKFKSFTTKEEAEKYINKR